MEIFPISKDGAVRFQVVFSQKLMSILDSLREITGATTAVEVLRNAIKVYSLVVDESQKGNKLYIKDSEGNVSEIRIVF